MTHQSQNTSIVSTANSTLNGTALWKQYVFTPAGLGVKLTISVLIAVSAVIGFVGNLCVLRFTNDQEKKPARARSSNLNFVIRSLALSDVLTSFVGLPVAVIQINFDVFQSKWPCIISRFVQQVFIVITIYNLVVIGVERYICTCRPTSRPISADKIKAAVKVAWVLGFSLSCFSAYATDAIRVDLNSTHYTVVCRYDYGYHATRVVVYVSGTSTYVLPMIVLIFTCVSIMRVLWRRKPTRQANSDESTSAASRRWRAKRNKATAQLMLIIIAFIVPYLLFMGYGVFNAIFNPPIDFQADYTVRLVGGMLIYLNGSVNFVIHLAQLSGFRQATKSYVVCCQSRWQEYPVQNNRLRRIGPPNAVAPIEAAGTEP